MSILRADSIRDRAGTGAPDFPNGLTGTLTGTASALGSSATGSDLTLSGNLTVNGTTTTIDTAVTAVDSLAVDGSVGIGTTNPQVQLHLTSADPYIRLQDTAAPTGYSQIMGTHQGAIAFSADTSNSVADSHLRFDVDGTERFRIDSSGLLGVGGNGTGSGLGVYLQRSSPATTHFYEASDGTKKMIAGVDSGNDYVKIGSLSNHPVGLVANNTERLRITSGGTAIFKGGLAEKVNVKTQFAGANSTSINDGNVILTTTAEPGNTYPNITGVHTVLSSGEGFSITIALKVNGSGTINNFYIDGVPQNIEWSGGSAPSAGASGYDVFTFSAMKTGTGTSDYTVFGAATNYA